MSIEWEWQYGRRHRVPKGNQLRNLIHLSYFAIDLLSPPRTTFTLSDWNQTLWLTTLMNPAEFIGWKEKNDQFGGERKKNPTCLLSSFYLNVSLAWGFNAGVMVLIQFGNNLTDISNYSTNLAVQSEDQGGYNGSWLNDSGSFDSKSFVIAYLGKQKGDTGLVVALTVVYMVVYLSGVLGNSLTFLVIYKNAYMRTVTNWYLMSLALSDLLTISVGEYTVCNIYVCKFPSRDTRPFQQINTVINIWIFKEVGCWCNQHGMNATRLNWNRPWN